MAVNVPDPTLERETTLDQIGSGIEEGGVLGGLGGAVKGLAGMLLPRAGLPGNRGLGSILNDFVEFSPLGDIGDVHAAVDPNSGLDPLERVIAGLPFLGVGAIGTRQAYKAYTKRHQESLAAPSMMPAEGGAFDLTSGFEELGGVDATPRQTRQQAAHFEQVALEAKSPFARGVLRADTWTELAQASLVSDDPHTVERMEASLRGVGAAVISQAHDVELYGTDPDTREFMAAKTALAKWNRAVELEVVVNESGRIEGNRNQIDLLGARAVEMAVKIAQLETATWMVGPDLSLASPGRLGAVWWNDRGEANVAYALVDGLLPNERVFDWVAGYPLLTGALRSKQQQIDMEAAEGNGAVSVAQGALETPAHPGDPAGGLDARVRMDWYPKFNSTANKLAEVTGYTVNQVAGILAALSANTKWIPDNLVGGVHVILQTGRTDLVPGTPEYTQAFKDVVLGAGWSYDLFDDSSAEIQAQFEQAPGQPGGIPDFDGLAEHYGNPENVTSPEGNLVGTADNTKKDKIDMILKGNLPPWIVLRGMKTNTFSQVGSDPSLVDLITIDVWNDRLWWGTRWVDSPLAHQGYTPKGQIEADAVYHDPISGDTVKGKVILDGLTKLQEDFGWDQKQVERWQALLTSFPTKTAQARFLAQARSHLLIRDEFDLEAGHQAQAGGWATVREKWDSLRGELDNATTVDEFNAIAQKGNLNSLMMSNVEGNPSMELTGAGMIWEPSAQIPKVLPTLKQLLQARKGMQRPASTRAQGAIIGVSSSNGQVHVYADRTVRGVSETLRHTTRTGLTIGPYELHIKSQPRPVKGVADHFSDTAGYTREDGRRAAGHQTVVLDPGAVDSPGTRAGDTLVVLIPEASLADAHSITDSQYPFDKSVTNAQSTVTAASRNKVEPRDLDGMSPAQLSEVLKNNDWGSISAYTEGATPGANWENQRLLRIAIGKAGGAIVDGEGRYEGDTEGSFLVTGLSYAELFRLGKKFGQESVATRSALIYMDGTYLEAKGDIATGDAVDQFNNTHLETGQSFSMEYDTNRKTLPADYDALADIAPQGQPMKQMTLGMGGQYGGATWNITDQVIQELSAIPGARVRFYTHSQNKIPPGFVEASESVVTDDAGVTGTTLMRNGDSYARHNNTVHIPAWEHLTLSEDGFNGERARRGTVDVRDILDIDQDTGIVTVDKDLEIHVDPEATVTMGKTGNLFTSLKVDGKSVRQISVDTNGPIPIVTPSEGAIPGPGVTIVNLTRGKATKIIPHGESDWTLAKEALMGVGLMPDGKSTVVEQAKTEGTPLDDSTLRVIFERGELTAGGGFRGALPSAIPTPDDIAMTEHLQGFLPNLSKANLGKNAHPELRETLKATLEGLHGLSFRYPGIKLLSAIPETVWKNSSGIETMHMINRPDLDAITMMKTDGGITFNERQVHDRWNNGVNITGSTDMVRPESMSDFESTLVHEMGHMVTRHISFAELKAKVEAAEKAMGGPAAARLNLSEYAMVNDREFLAEAFTKVMAEGENAHPVLVELVEEMIDNSA